MNQTPRSWGKPVEVIVKTLRGGSDIDRTCKKCGKLHNDGGIELILQKKSCEDVIIASTTFLGLPETSGLCNVCLREKLWHELLGPYFVPKW